MRASVTVVISVTLQSENRKRKLCGFCHKPYYYLCREAELQYKLFIWENQLFVWNLNTKKPKQKKIHDMYISWTFLLIRIISKYNIEFKLNYILMIQVLSVSSCCFWSLLHCCVFFPIFLCMLVLVASLRQSSSLWTGMPVILSRILVGLPLSSPQNKHLIILHTGRTISPTQSHTLQSSLQQRIIVDALAQREKTVTTTTTHWHISS